MKWKVKRIDGWLSKEEVLGLVREQELTRWSLVRGEDEGADRPLYLHPAFADAFTPLPEQLATNYAREDKSSWRAYGTWVLIGLPVGGAAVLAVIVIHPNVRLLLPIGVGLFAFLNVLKFIVYRVVGRRHPDERQRG